MAHLSPLPRDTHADLVERFEHYQNTRGFVPNSILTMQRRPNIARAFMALNQAILYEGTVSEELKMLVSLIASQAAGCQYCQAHMANLASIYEASADKIAAVWEYQSSPLFSEAERAALNVAFKGSIVPNEASEADFDQLKAHFDDDQIVEIVASIALFGYLNRWNDTMATDLEDYPTGVAETLISGKGWSPGKHGGS
ncbi:MAG: peroxidase-related enzyme [Pseudomonadota bacterium]